MSNDLQPVRYILELYVGKMEKPDDVFEASTPFGPFVVGNLFETLDHGTMVVTGIRINLTRNNGRITQKQSLWIDEPSAS